MKNRKAICLFILLLLCPNISFGQLIYGKLINSKDSSPIPFANILIKGTQTGTVSNEDGEFELSEAQAENDYTIVISVIGFKTKEVQLSKDRKDSNLIIPLEENVLELQEVVVTYLSASEILDNFHKNYAANYDQGATLHKAFYHSTLSENGTHKYLLESTVNIREFSQKKGRSFEVEITQGRKSNDYRVERWNEKNNYLFDAIASNPILDLSEFLDTKNQKHYELKRLDNTTYNDKTVYVIQFKPKEKVSKPLYKAIAYFNSEDFALINAEYDFQNEDLKIKKQKLKDRTYHIPFISGSVQYQKTGKYYTPKYLNYINGWTIFNNISNDTIANDILRDEILFLESEQDNDTPFSNPLTKWGDIYQKPFPYDTAFWNNQVKIIPSKSFEKAIEDLEKHQPIEIQYFNNSAKNMLLQNFENTTSGKIDSILTVYHLTNLFNGVALITKNDEVIHHQKYGYQDIENGIALDTSSIFDIGSITKQFTTAIILKLREEGKLNLEDTVGKYLPNYRYANEISIHQLLAHRTGIPTFDYQEKLNHSKWFNTKVSTPKMIDSFCSNDLEFEPGSQMEYSNSNFIILSAIIEAIEGKDYYAVLDELIFQPCNLINSYRPDSLPSQNVANGYILEGNHYISEPNWVKSNIKGAGCVYSTSRDLLKWIKLMNSDQFLSPSDIDLIKSPISYYDYYDADFGYSWAINKTLINTKQQAYFYGGTSLGFFSMITSIPESGVNIILLNNKGNFPRIALTNDILNVIE